MMGLKILNFISKHNHLGVELGGNHETGIVMRLDVIMDFDYSNKACLFMVLKIVLQLVHSIL